MKYLFDTHAFIWLDNEPEKLSPKVAEICANQNNLLLLSLATIWEMQIKLQLGKLTLPASLADTIQNQLNNNQIQLLPIQVGHILALDNLPHHDKDPFDRLMIAQAIYEKAIIITQDSKFAGYLVRTFW